MESGHSGSWIICRYDTVDSTQRVAADLVAGGAAHRTAVVAHQQTAGYGRKGDAWKDEPGASLLVSLILRPTATTALPHYAMIAALAVVDAIAAVGGSRAAIKWPNDILINGRKVAGILGDATWRGAHLDAIRLGIGLNVGGDRASLARKMLPDATSIAAETGRAIDRNVVLAALLNHFTAREDRLARDAGVATMNDWRRAMLTIGQEVVVTLRDSRVMHGIAESVTSDGDLILIADDGARVQIAATETRSLRHVRSTAGRLP